MALKPKDLRLTEEETKWATDYEVEIDQKLEKLFIPGLQTYTVSLSTPPTPRIQAEIVRRYRAGEGAWSIVAFRDNYYVDFQV